jgi:hypothetical protein
MVHPVPFLLASLSRVGRGRNSPRHSYLNSFNAILNSEASARLRFACSAVAPEVRNHLAVLDRPIGKERLAAE